MFNAMFAVDEAGGMGYQNTLPWPKNKEDMEWFRSHSIGDVVVMGRKTWDSDMPTPLKGRTNVVVTSRPDDVSGAITIPSIMPENIDNQSPHALHRFKNVWVIGGAKLITSLTGSFHRIYMTRIPGIYPADTFLDVEELLNGYQRLYYKKTDTAEFMIYEKL